MERATAMTQTRSNERPARTIKAPERTRKYDNKPASLGSYLVQGAGGVGFMMFVFWLAGFGS